MLGKSYGINSFFPFAHKFRFESDFFGFLFVLYLRFVDEGTDFSTSSPITRLNRRIRDASSRNDGCDATGRM